MGSIHASQCTECAGALGRQHHSAAGRGPTFQRSRRREAGQEPSTAAETAPAGRASHPRHQAALHPRAGPAAAPVPRAPQGQAQQQRHVPRQAPQQPGPRQLLQWPLPPPPQSAEHPSPLLLLSRAPPLVLSPLPAATRRCRRRGMAGRTTCVEQHHRAILCTQPVDCNAGSRLRQDMLAPHRRAPT